MVNTDIVQLVTLVGERPTACFKITLQAIMHKADNFTASTYISLMLALWCTDARSAAMCVLRSGMVQKNVLVYYVMLFSLLLKNKIKVVAFFLYFWIATRTGSNGLTGCIRPRGWRFPTPPQVESKWWIKRFHVRTCCKEDWKCKATYESVQTEEDFFF